MFDKARLPCAWLALAMVVSACTTLDMPAQPDHQEPQASLPTASEPNEAPTPSNPVALTPATPVPITGQWEGRLSLKLGAFGREPSQGSQMAFELDVKNNRGTLSLSTPLGTRMAMVHWQAEQTDGTVQARLETSEGVQAFASLEDLTQQLLGEALPLHAMLHWLSGHPAPGSPFVAGAGQSPVAPKAFSQAGWQVDATELGHGRLNAQREETPTQRGVTLRLRLDL